jgi:hypothetical protein
MNTLIDIIKVMYPLLITKRCYTIDLATLGISFNVKDSFLSYEK